MLERLRQVDPDSAARLHTSDRKRILRALEVFLETGKTITRHNWETRQVPDKYDPVWIGLDFLRREDLYRRIDLRVEKMVEQGLLDEIRSLLKRGVPRTCTAMQAIGYKEFFPVLDGTGELATAVAAVQQGSRRYAKRQLTWFRKNPAIHWILQPENPDFSEIFQNALGHIPFFDGAM